MRTLFFPMNLARTHLFACMMLVCFLGSGAALAQNSGKAKPKKTAQRQTAAAKLFTSPEILRLQIQISEPDIEKLKKFQWTFGQQAEREAVQATIREGTKVYTNVSLHLKGAAGSFRPITDKPAFTLNFDKFADGQRFHGLQKISLNNSVQDPTYVSEQFSREVFLKAGVPVPRATHARLELNGRDLGLYVLVEGWDKDFLKLHFKNPDGNLYDGGFIKEVSDELSTNAGENPKDQADRKALAEAAKETDLKKRRQRLEETLDLDRFFSFVALDVILWNWDGYAMNRNNWRLYHDVDKKKMVFMPHGLDQMFWKPEGSILPAMQGQVARAVMQIPEFRQRYLARVKELRTSVFDAPALTNRVRQIAAKIRPLVAETQPDEIKQHDQAVTDFCNAIVRRATSLDSQLAHPIQPVQFDGSGLASLADWKSKNVFGKASLAQANDQGTKGMLKISAQEGSSIGQWSTGVWLEPGKYKLQGKIKTTAIVADPGDPRAGAGFRTKNNRPENYRLGNSDWKQVDVEFNVAENLTEMQLLCEFRGMEGEAWFDLDSLKLKRIEPQP